MAYMNERDIQQALIDMASDHLEERRPNDEDIDRWEAPEVEETPEAEYDPDPDWGW